jgi:diketogulonate reductase-like aldo/keto reductase
MRATSSRTRSSTRPSSSSQRSTRRRRHRVVLRWHLEHGVSAIPKSVKPHRIKENCDVFDFALAPEEVTAIDALDTGVRGGPDPELIDTKLYPFNVEN